MARSVNFDPFRFLSANLIQVTALVDLFKEHYCDDSDAGQIDKNLSTTDFSAKYFLRESRPIELSRAAMNKALDLLGDMGLFEPIAPPADLKPYRVVVAGGSYGSMLEALTALGIRNADCLFSTSRRRSDQKDGDVPGIMRHIENDAPYVSGHPYYTNQLAQDDPVGNEQLLGILAALEVAGGVLHVFLENGMLKNSNGTLVLKDVPNARELNRPTTTSSFTAWYEWAKPPLGCDIVVVSGAVEGRRIIGQAERTLHELEAARRKVLGMDETPTLTVYGLAPTPHPAAEPVKLVRSGMIEVAHFLRLTT